VGCKKWAYKGDWASAQWAGAGGGNTASGGTREVAHCNQSLGGEMGMGDEREWRKEEGAMKG